MNKLYGLSTFFSRHSETLPQRPPAKPAPKPHGTIQTTHVSEEDLSKYVQVATDLSLENGALIRLRMAQFFEQRLIPVYPYPTVAAYLGQEATRLHGSQGDWWWEPLRPQDCATYQNGWLTPPPTRHPWWQDSSKDYRYCGALRPTAEPYDKMIPLRVLQRVKIVSEEFPNASFYVSEIGETKADPFLGVTARGMELLVIDQWDEPGFGFPVL